MTVYNCDNQYGTLTPEKLYQKTSNQSQNSIQKPFHNCSLNIKNILQPWTANCNKNSTQWMVTRQKFLIEKVSSSEHRWLESPVEISIISVDWNMLLLLLLFHFLILILFIVSRSAGIRHSSPAANWLLPRQDLDEPISMQKLLVAQSRTHKLCLQSTGATLLQASMEVRSMLQLTTMKLVTMSDRMHIAVVSRFIHKTAYQKAFTYRSLQLTNEQRAKACILWIFISFHAASVWPMSPPAWHVVAADDWEYCSNF